MAITREQVEKVARLARLKLGQDELSAMSVHLGAIVDYVEQLRSVDTEGVAPMAHASATSNVFRDDQSVPSLTVDEALANAPKRVGDFFAVPPVFD